MACNNKIITIIINRLDNIYKFFMYVIENINSNGGKSRKSPSLKLPQDYTALVLDHKFSGK